jgi:hypothetical protein
MTPDDKIREVRSRRYLCKKCGPVGWHSMCPKCGTATTRIMGGDADKNRYAAEGKQRLKG